MTKEEKELLLKDLCARLPYNVICSTVFGDCAVLYVDMYEGTIYIPCNEWIYDFKPYLRPMSSMTEEEKKEYYNLCEICVGYDGKYSQIKVFDWLNKHHFDYRGLIEKGLAIEAPEGMYES